MNGVQFRHGWPELLRPGTAAAMLDMSESSFRLVWPILSAHFGLPVHGLAGPKFRRDQLLRVVRKLTENGLSVRLDVPAGLVWIGDTSYPIRSSASGHSRRGRPPKIEGTGR